MNTEIKVMSFNLRYENNYDGIYRFENRKPQVLAAIEEEKPDLIGFQEGTDPMRAWLGASLSDYLVLSCGRNNDYSGEGGPIAIRRDRFNLLSYRTVWLSPTPNVPGSRYTEDQSPCPRIYQEARLVIPKYDRVIRFVNTHTDHVGSRARLLEATQLLKDMGDVGNDILVITGDFNATPDAPEIRYMTEGRPELSLSDASAALGGTFHEFGRVEPIKIDYIFTNVPYRDSRQIHREPDFISDHDPIVTTLIPD
ncbi:MAG: endonuclease/exonuclease/phosphatase family protein [Clostridia bacterium]|nr:endonuclease/exonuclease/phosphatase family protein [Clostridia bacterium]